MNKILDISINLNDMIFKYIDIPTMYSVFDLAVVLKSFAMPQYMGCRNEITRSIHKQTHMQQATRLLTKPACAWSYVKLTSARAR